MSGLGFALTSARHSAHLSNVSAGRLVPTPEPPRLPAGPRRAIAQSVWDTASPVIKPVARLGSICPFQEADPDGLTDHLLMQIC